MKYEAPDLRAVKAVLRQERHLEPEHELGDELDSETWTALFSYAMAHGFEWSLEAYEDEDGEVPPAVLEALLERHESFSANAGEELSFTDYADEVSVGEGALLDLNAVEVFDVTGQHELVKGRPDPRAVGQITTIVLHQTAVKFGTTEKNRKKYGERVALHRRFFDVACHAAALMNGDVVLVNGWRRYVFHGNTSNRFSIGIEIEGLYAGIEGDPTTVWKRKTPHTLTSRTIAAARKATQLAVEQGRQLGCPITKLAAHRQFHNSRISDPGQEIWREVGLWAAQNLGLTIDYNFVLATGRKIPREWDPSGKVGFR